MSKVAVNLHPADRDYDDQRHEAVEHVRAAVGALHAAEPDTSGKFGGMTRAESDRILRDCLLKLQAVPAELSAKGDPEHHQAAQVKLDAAINKIRIALKIP